MMYDTLIRQTFDVVSTSGEEMLCRCPWHQDGQKPNLYVNARKGVYLCHSCGAKGHLRHIAEKMPSIRTQDVRDKLAAMQLARRPGVVKVFSEGWLKKFEFHHEQWDQRLTSEVQSDFGLGYDPFEDVLTIPLRDHRGRLLGVITRRLDDLKPKYRYPKGFKIGQHLFASWKIKTRHKKVALVEGSVDTMACWEARIPALGLLGSRLTEDQTRLIQRLGIKHVVLMLDNDKAGNGWPTHRIEGSWQGGKFLCRGCHRTFPERPTGTHPAAGRFQVYEALHDTGIKVSVGVYRSYWSEKDPAALKPDRRRKMFHSAKEWHSWNHDV